MLHHLWFVPVVTVTPPSISISTSINRTSNDMNLICWLEGFSPKTINVDWGSSQKGTEKIFKNEGKKEFSMLSQISINEQQWTKGKEFTCNATHQAKTFRQTWSICKDHPNSEPQIHLIKPPLRSILTDNQVTVSCVVQTVFHPKVSWLVDGNKKSDRDRKREGQEESTVSNLTISVEDWTKSRTITCRAEHPCFKTIEASIKTTETVQKTPTVVIRRSPADVGKRDSAVLECVASSLPSGELSVTFQANDEKFPEAQYVNLPEGQDTLITQFTIPKPNQTKNNNFACQIQQSHSQKWKSGPLKNLFDDASVDLTVVSSVNKSASSKQKLLCSATGFNPEIKWFPESVGNAVSEVTMNAGGRVKVSRELSVTEQEWKRGTTFTCQVRDQSLTKNIQKSINVCEGHPNSGPRIHLKKPPLKSILTDKQVTVSCVVESVFHPKVSLLVDGVNKTDKDIIREVSSVSNLTISVEDWTKSWNITCRAEHPCFKTIEASIKITETVQKTPTVVIRRSLADVGKRDSAVLECVASSLPSGELSVNFLINDEKIPEAQYVNLPEVQETLITQFTIPKTSQTKNNNFACQIQQSHSQKWNSQSSIKNLFDDPSVELSVVSSADKSTSRKQKLLCSATGFNPEIKWLPESVGNADSEVTMNADGRVKVSSELSVTEQKWKNETRFTCQVSDRDRLTVQKNTSFCAVTPDHVQRSQVYLLGPSLSDMLENNPVPVICLLLGHRVEDFSVNCTVGTAKLPLNPSNPLSPQIQNHGNGTESVRMVFKVPADSWKNHETVFCEVKHPCSNAQTYNISKPKASVKNPPIVKLLQGQDELVCLAYGYSPSAINITWLLNKETVEYNGTSSSARGPDGKFMIKSHLNVKTSKWESGSTYTCLVQHITGPVYLNVSKAEFIEQAIYIDDNKSDINTVDQAEETWNMACAFIILFVISLIYGCSITLVKVKTA